MLLPHGEAGDGRTVVLLHARPTDRRMWREHLPLLAAAGNRAIALDLPGYGGAVLPEGHAAPPADDVLETLDALGVGRWCRGWCTPAPRDEQADASRLIDELQERTGRGR